MASLQIWHANFAGYYSGVEGAPLLLGACPLQKVGSIELIVPDI